VESRAQLLRRLADGSAIGTSGVGELAETGAIWSLELALGRCWCPRVSERLAVRLDRDGRRGGALVEEVVPGGVSPTGGDGAPAGDAGAGAATRWRAGLASAMPRGTVASRAILAFGIAVGVASLFPVLRRRTVGAPFLITPYVLSRARPARTSPPRVPAIACARGA
jgi:hypothetical protein